MTTQYRPPSFTAGPDGDSAKLDFEQTTFYSNLDLAIQTMYNLVYTAANTPTKFGSSQVTGSLSSVATGLSAVAQVVATVQSSTAINEWATVTLNADGTFNIFVWKPTAAGDTTPIASTTARTVLWAAQGTQ